MHLLPGLTDLLTALAFISALLTPSPPAFVSDRSKWSKIKEILLHVLRNHFSPNESEKSEHLPALRSGRMFLCLFAEAYKGSLKVHRPADGIGFPPPFLLPGTRSQVWINGANWGFDRTNSHWLMSHTGLWMFRMLQLKRPPHCEVANIQFSCVCHSSAGSSTRVLHLMFLTIIASVAKCAIRIPESEKTLLSCCLEGF